MDVTLTDVLLVKSGRTVLHIPSLTFPSGTTTAVFGPNGSGKTTLLRTIAGLEKPARGEVRLGGLSTGEHHDTRIRIGMGFQAAVFLRGSVRQNLDLALRLRKLHASERQRRIEDASRECGVVHLLDRPARSLSGGEAQRVNLTRVLSLQAPVTLLDEPLSGVDRSARNQLLADLPRLLPKFAATTILVTHDREEAFRLADRLVILAGGEVRAAGSKSWIYAHPPDRETAELLGYTVLPHQGRLVAIAPGSLTAGNGSPSFLMEVERVIDMGNHQHVVGTIEDQRVDLRLSAGVTAPLEGSSLKVHGESGAITLRA